MNLPHDTVDKECSCTRCLMAVRSEIERAAKQVVLANINVVLSIQHARLVGETYQRRLNLALEPLRLARVVRS